MPIITQLDLLDIPVGPASTFRGNLNENFDRIKAKVQEILDNNNTIILSKTQPTSGTQRKGDLWLKEL